MIASLDVSQIELMFLWWGWEMEKCWCCRTLWKVAPQQVEEGWEGAVPKPLRGRPTVGGPGVGRRTAFWSRE